MGGLVCSGIPGRFAPDWVADLKRNQWPVWTGILRFYRMPGYEGKNDEFNKEISPLLNKYYRDAMAGNVHMHKNEGAQDHTH